MKLSPPIIAYFQQPLHLAQQPLSDAQWTEIRGQVCQHLKKRFSTAPNLRREFLEDLCQESLVRFYEHHQAKGSLENPVAVLTMITNNVFVDYCRRSKNNFMSFDDEIDAGLTEFWRENGFIPLSGEKLNLYLESVFRIPDVAVFLSPQATQLQAELIAQEGDQPYFCLKSAALQLTDRQKAFIYLFSWKKLSPNEIAAYMNRHFPRKSGASWSSDTVSTEVSKFWKGRCQRHYIRLYRQCLEVRGFGKHPFSVS